MAFREKMLWLLFASLIGVFGFYFVTVLPGAGKDVMPGHVARFVAVVAVLVVIQVVGAIVLAVLNRPRDEADERDRLIGLRSTRNGSYVLAVGVFCSLTAAVFTEGNFVFTHLLLGFWVVAQLVELGSQLFLYRRGY